MEQGGQTQRAVAKFLQVELVGLGRAQKLNAGLAQAVFLVGLYKAQVGRTAGQEHVNSLGAAGLDALGKGRKVGGAHRHADRLGDLAAQFGELGLKSVFSVNAGCKIRHGGDHALVAFFGRVLRRRHRDLPQRVAGADVVVRLGGDVAGCGIEDHHGRLGLLDDWRHRRGIRREHDAAYVVHLVFDHQLLGQRAGVGRVGAALVTPDEFDVLTRELAALAGHVSLGAGLHQGAVMRERT